MSDLPKAFHEALDRGLVALGVALAPGARAAIETHVRLLLAWNAAINLTAITDPEAVAVRHVVDSLTALPLLVATTSLLDLGSGGGFPGLPLAAALPAASVTLLDAKAKKAAFLDAAIEATGLAPRVVARAARAESLAGGPGVDAVVARGVGALADLVEVALPLLRVGGMLIAWKRGDLASELEAGARAAAALGAAAPRIHPVQVIAGLDGHVLIVVGKAGPTPAGFPRDPGARRRQPW